MLILFKFDRNNIKKIDIDDNYTFKKISIKLQKLGYTDKNIKFIYLGNIIHESQKLNELYIGKHSYISVIKCKEKTERRNYLRELCNIFTDMYSQDSTLSNITNSSLLNINLVNEINNETSGLDSVLNDNSLDTDSNNSENNQLDMDFNNSDNNLLDTDSNNSDNNLLDSSGSDNQEFEEEHSDNHETSSESHLIEENSSNDNTEITEVQDSDIQETLTGQIENILDSTISNTYFIPQSNPEERMNQLLEMGYTDRNLNQMALDSNHNNINLSIEWMEQFR